MGFTRNPRFPGEVRAVMQSMYDRYAVGLDMFPRAKFLGEVEQFPRKTQPIAKLLFKTWHIIDEDRSYFQDAVLTGVEKLRASTGQHGLVITRIGRNAVGYADIRSGEPPTIMGGEFGLEEFTKTFEGLPINVADGRTLILENGEMRGNFDAAIVRTSNISGLVVARPPEPPIENVETTLV